jgi:hypothetical protein
MNEVWKEIGEKALKRKGVNNWVYPAEDRISVGVELRDDPNAETILERKEIVLPRYAYWKHVGAYSKLAEVHEAMHMELQRRGIRASRPSVEVCGHWTEGESRLETEVLIAVA